MKRFSLILVSIFFALVATAQEPADSVATVVNDTTAAAPRSSCSISGRVVDEEQKPLPFVTVKVEGQMAGAVTNLDGRYSFDFQTADSVVINYSLIGYEKKSKTLMHPQGKLVWNVTIR